MRQATSRKASFDAGSQERRLMIAKVHVAKKELRLEDDDYRAMVIQVTGRSSSADCSLAELRQLIEHMKSKGFQAKPATRGAADHPAAQKARALWISLYHLGAIDNSSEEALEAFAKRQLGCQKLQWANQAQAYKLIEALKAIATRNGWEQRIASTFGMKPVKADTALRILKVRLVERIAHLLSERGIVPADWPLKTVAWRLAGMERADPVTLWSLGDLDLLASALGKKLREAGK